MADPVNHPAHYGTPGDPYEAIRVIHAWDLGFNLGNAAKYICRAGKKGSRAEDLRKAIWYLQDELAREEGQDPSWVDDGQGFQAADLQSRDVYELQDELAAARVQKDFAAFCAAVLEAGRARREAHSTKEAGR